MEGSATRSRSLLARAGGIALVLAALPGCPAKATSTEARGATAVGTASAPVATGTASAAPAAGAAPKLDRLARPEFNARAVERGQPLFWRTDANGNGALDPDELVTTWGRTPRRLAEFVGANGQFTPELLSIYESMQKPLSDAGLTPLEKARREVVRSEVGDGRPTLLESDFSKVSEGEKSFVAHMLRAAAIIERLHARQKGVFGMEAKIPAGDVASAALFFRNQGAFCESPKTENNPDCNALPDRPKPIYGLYPAEIQSNKRFCEVLEKQPNGKELLDHFSVVVPGDAPNRYRAVKYTVAYEPDMTAVAAELEAAAAPLGDDETALKKYLAAAAQAFRTNDWEPANEAWVAMGPGNSKYYLRVAADEVYYEPCAWKAGFALTLAHINRESLVWQQKLEPIKQEMEEDFARLAGKPYKARQVKFKLPDFIDIVLNAGEARAAFGATIGQSLPNWGPVAERGGRTVTMVNLYTDPDSQKALTDQMASTYCPATMSAASADPRFLLMGVVLHEAAHNLGPAHDYKVDGKNDAAAFGGPLASTLEELKAQTAALYFPSKLVDKKLVTPDEVQKGLVREVAWVLGNVAQGMYNAEGKPKNYSQLAAIQLGVLMTAGALEWKAGETAANAQDRGCFDIHFDKWDAAAADLMGKVLAIKGHADKAAAEKLKQRWVDADGDGKKLRETIAERWLRAPRASFVYSLGGVSP